MNNVVTVQLEWTYTPKNYLEEQIDFIEEQYSISISEGTAIANINPDYFHNYENIKEELTAKVESRFYAVQVFNHSSYDLSAPTRIDITDDGKQNVFLEIQSAVRKGSSLFTN